MEQQSIDIIPKYQEHIYDVPFLSKTHKEFVLWFYTGSKCNLSCTHCYVESSPTANQHPLLSMETFNAKLDEAVSKNYKKLDIYFTGGEPFINPNLLQMFENSLKHGNTTVLTNATKITKKKALELSKIQENSSNKLVFRVSLDGATPESNDKIRGKKAFERATIGIQNLVNQGFNPIVTTMRSWSLLSEKKVEDQFIQLLVNHGIPKENQILKILPPLRIGREVTRDRGYGSDELFTEECFDDYDFNNLQCSKCRMVTERGVWVCPILVNVDSAKMGETLSDTEKPYAMRDMACWTCRMDGMVCTND
ncbi:MAG: Antilisterial bacteriocin subtilosin biosynthesis protein AlbA [Candidatus Heimdallarchaeota archaeon LC_2]|nr:MAG: Antilisterial bacteriocin subtilosin biosynthesis protein AlbA [Candidatus Heimdallarchaeota archaeon LC_2]